MISKEPTNTQLEQELDQEWLIIKQRYAERESERLKNRSPLEPLLIITVIVSTIVFATIWFVGTYLT